MEIKTSQFVITEDINNMYVWERHVLFWKLFAPVRVCENEKVLR